MTTNAGTCIAPLGRPCRGGTLTKGGKRAWLKLGASPLTSRD